MPIVRDMFETIGTVAEAAEEQFSVFIVPKRDK